MTERATDGASPAPVHHIANAALVDAILAAVEVGAKDRLVQLLEPFHEADIADLIEQIDPASRAKLIRLWGDDIYPLVLSELEEGVRNLIVPLLSESQLQRVVAELETDDVVYLVEDLAEGEQEKVLGALDEAERAVVENSLAYPEYSAGRLMQRELVTAPEHWTVGEIIDFMREQDHLPEIFYDVVIIDPRVKPVGTVTLSRIMANRREVALKSLMSEDFRTFAAETPQEEVAYAFNHYHMVSAPVVDGSGRLVGVVTIDDAMEILEDEADEDMKRLAGVGDEELSDRVWATARLRFPWLAVNIATALVASSVIALFSAAIDAYVALAILMPIVASLGGNAGTQTLTVAVRALATRSLTAANTWRIVRREALVGLLNGLLLGLIVGAVGTLWFGEPLLGAVIWAAMLCNLAVAALMGILVPLALSRAGADPAVASSVFVTMSTDVIGFLAFLGLASAVLL